MSQRSGAAPGAEDESYSFRPSWWQRVRDAFAAALGRGDGSRTRR